MRRIVGCAALSPYIWIRYSPHVHEADCSLNKIRSRASVNASWYLHRCASSGSVIRHCCELSFNVVSRIVDRMWESNVEWSLLNEMVRFRYGNGPLFPEVTSFWHAPFSRRSAIIDVGEGIDGVVLMWCSGIVAWRTKTAARNDVASRDYWWKKFIFHLTWLRNECGRSACKNLSAYFGYVGGWDDLWLACMRTSLYGNSQKTDRWFCVVGQRLAFW